MIKEDENAKKKELLGKDAHLIDVDAQRQHRDKAEAKMGNDE